MADFNRKTSELVLKKYKLKDWNCTDKSSIFFGQHDSGVANIPDGHFKDEEMEAWIAEGKLTLITE